MLRPTSIAIAFLTALCLALPCRAENPKREFRGAWLHTVNQNHFAQRSAAGNMEYLRAQLDAMQRVGVNAVIFQVRPTADAFYESPIEPWSAYLTGQVGTPPAEFWDPLEFMVDECHLRGMELHAWLNPYRSVKVGEKIPDNHHTKTYPARYITFDGRKYFDPGQPENRQLINDIVRDIVARYDIDAIHMDDYFYPYPVKGVRFNDDASYKKYGAGMKLADWRRHNVDLLIQEVSATIRDVKPWVRFGISPFGIWRNASSDPEGSATRGLQNYDDLYADVIMWAREGWIDYQAPQLYWDMDHRVAPSRILAPWWSNHAYGRHVYIGQDVERTMNSGELDQKMALSRKLENIQGNVWWPSVSLTANFKGVADSLAANAQSNVALTPRYDWLDPLRGAVRVAPPEIALHNGTLYWDFDESQFDESCSMPAGVVIYCSSKEPKKLGDEEDGEIVAVVRGAETSWKIDPSRVQKSAFVYVRAIDMLNRESTKSRHIKVK